MNIALVGSSKHWHKSTKAFCVKLGAELSKIDDLIVFTGGLHGPPETVMCSYISARGTNQFTAHYIPQVAWLGEGSSKWGLEEFSTIPVETTKIIGTTDDERSQLMAADADVLIAIEGGPQTCKEIDYCKSSGGKCIVVRNTSPVVDKLHPSVTYPSQEDFPVLADPNDWTETEINEVVAWVINKLKA